MLTNVKTENIRPTTVDLRLARIFTLSADVVDIDAGEMPDIQEQPLPYELQPGEYVLAQTIEEVHQEKPTYACLLSARSRAFRAGLAVQTNIWDPYYEGPVTFGIKNASRHPVRLTPELSIVQLGFVEIRGQTKPVEHTFQGGKVV